MSVQLRVGIGLVGLAAAAAVVRLALLGGKALERDPRAEAFEVSFEFAFDGASDRARVRFPVPATDLHQRVSQAHCGPEARFHRRYESGRLVGTVDLASASGEVAYGFIAQMRETTVRIPAAWTPPATLPQEVEEYLSATERVQSTDPEVVALARRLGGADAVSALRAFHAYAHDEVRYVSVPGFADALSALRDGRSDCGGKSRLFVALCRASRIPARTVTGVLLEPGTKESLHTWAEAWIDGRWVPECATRDSLGRLPAAYLALARDDGRVFEAEGIRDFAWDVHATRGPGQAVRDVAEAPSCTLWPLVEATGLPDRLVRVIVLVPLGALLVAMARIFVGLEIYGTFLPVLAALAFRESGFWVGSALFFGVLAAGLLVRALLDPMKLLMVARLAIVMTLSIALLVLASMIGVWTGTRSLEAATLLPIVILTMMVERFYVVQLERGRRAAVQIALHTWLLTAAVFAVVTCDAVQVLVLSFPELLLAVVGLQVLVGRWTGLRLYELWKFRDVFVAAGRECAAA